MPQEWTSASLGVALFLAGLFIPASDAQQTSAAVKAVQLIGLAGSSLAIRRLAWDACFPG